MSVAEKKESRGPWGDCSIRPRGTLFMGPDPCTSENTVEHGASLHPDNLWETCLVYLFSRHTIP